MPFTSRLQTLARRVARFDWVSAPLDTAANLYQTVIPAAERRQLGEYYTPSWLRRCPPTAAPAGPASKDPITVPTAGPAAPPAISAPLLISRRRLSSRSGRLSETLFTDPRYMSPCSKRQSKPYTEKGRFAPAIR